MVVDAVGAILSGEVGPVGLVSELPKGLVRILVHKGVVHPEKAAR